jgi:sugar phosphate isomerase/epimerase
MGAKNYMELGISTATFFLRENTEDAFNQIKRLGLSLCEVFLTTFSEYDEQFAILLNERKGDIRVHSVHAYNTAFEPQLYNRADRTRFDGEYYFKKVLRAAQIIGAKYYTFHGQARLKKTAKLDMNWVGPRTQELWRLANGYGVELCFENVHWASFNSPDFFAQVKENSPDIKACLDIKQAMQSGVSYSDYLEVMGERLKTVHISDYDENGNTCLLGEGIFDFKTLFSRLVDMGYDGPVIIEQYSRDYTDIAHLKRGAEYIREILDKIG